MAFGTSYTLETRLQWNLAPCFLLSFYNNITVQVSGVISCISGGGEGGGGISFPRFPDGVFSKIQWGWGPLDGVSVKRMRFQ